MTKKHYPQFTLRIALGNDAMRHPDHVALALQEVAAKLLRMGFNTSTAIMDVNGNKVGEWGAEGSDEIS